MRLRRRSTTKRGAPHVRRKLDGNHELATRASTDRPSRVCEVLQSSARGPWKRGAPKNNRRLTQSLIAHTSARIACKLASGALEIRSCDARCQAPPRRPRLVLQTDACVTPTPPTPPDGRQYDRSNGQGRIEEANREHEVSGVNGKVAAVEEHRRNARIRGGKREERSADPRAGQEEQSVGRERQMRDHVELRNEPTLPNYVFRYRLDRSACVLYDTTRGRRRRRRPGAPRRAGRRRRLPPCRRCHHHATPYRTVNHR